MKGASGRTPEQLREQYEVERRLATRLKGASKEERKTLYGSVYDELFRSVPHHPQLTRKENAERELREGLVRGLADLLERFVKSDTRFLEVGAGDCRLTLHVAAKAKQAYALDVSAQISHNEAVPANFKLILSDGTNVPLDAGSLDLVFSHQLLEHVHPEDALEQLRNVHAALAAGGEYICITPSSFSGPHDISKYFEDVPGGFHLKEYSTGELVRLFRQAGFTRFHGFFWSKGVLLRIPVWPILAVEGCLRLLPRGLQRKLADGYPLNRLLGNFIAGK
jgi:hypothetical protein